MTNDEKAKAYDEALDRMKHVVIVPKDEKALQALKETIFPELAEIEDERIRKALVWHLKAGEDFVSNGVTKAECIAYLEKQKEPCCTDEVQKWKKELDSLCKEHYGQKSSVWDNPIMTNEMLMEKQKEPEKEELAYRLNGLMQDYINEGKDDEEKEHRLKCYKLFWDALEDASYFEQKEQNLASTEDMPYVADEHFFEQEPADSFKYRLAEYITKNCKKGEGPYGYSYNISSESILQMAKEELIKRGEMKEQKHVEVRTPTDEEIEEARKQLHKFKVFVVKTADKHQVCFSYDHDFEWDNFCGEILYYLNGNQKPAEWSEEDKKLIDDVINSLCCYQNTLSDYQKEIVGEEIRKLKSLKPQPKQEWSEEDERMLSRCEKSIESSKQFADSDTFKKAKDNEIDWLINRFKSLRPSWKPSEEQMNALNFAITYMFSTKANPTVLRDLYDDLLKLK